jgi:hypothetical protein
LVASHGLHFSSPTARVASSKRSPGCKISLMPEEHAADI